MATVLAGPQKIDRDDYKRRVAHPLQRLSTTIRAYVTLEGAAVLLLYAALWFWIGLLLDFGVFKTFTVDWVQELPWMFRATLLCLVGGGLVLLVLGKIVFRLSREFHHKALALVLERRFPHELGDRLITAVEMADPVLTAKYGYSQVMVDQTIHDAAERVDRLPLGEVFNWRRLRRAGLYVLALTLGLYLLVGSIYCVAASESAGNFVTRFNTVAGIWFERNILLRDTIWPRRAHLELIGFPDSGELRIGRDAPAPTLRVRAIKWVFADRSAPEGWRALRWSDLTPEMVGPEPLPMSLPSAWQDWTVDQIDLALQKQETVATLDSETFLSLRHLLDNLHESAQQPRIARTMRELEIPADVTVYYRGVTIRSEQTLKKQSEQEYSGVLSELRETIRFTVNAADYYTPYKLITLVPPPSLVSLSRDEEQPAYVFHRPPLGGKPADLRGKKQVFHGVPVSLSGLASHFDVPAGTNVVLMGSADKPLQDPIGVIMRPNEGSAPITAPVRRTGPQSFEVRFVNLAAPLDFVFEMTDTDNVVGGRHVVIKPLDDTPPDVDVGIEVIRKTNQGYMCTPVAKIPFIGKIRDDHGLDKIEYSYTLASLDIQPTAMGPVVSALQFTPSVLSGRLAEPGYLTWVSGYVRAVNQMNDRPTESVPMTGFAARLKDKARADVSAEEFLRRLQMTPLRDLPRERALDEKTEFWSNGLINFHNVDPEEESFDLEPLGLKVSGDRTIQPRYKMRLWVTATDNNVETGPGISPSKEKFVVLIVSENELLVEIGKDEEGLHVKLEDTVGKLRDGRNKLERVLTELPNLAANEFSPMVLRAEEIQSEGLTKGSDVCREIFVEYRKILKELQVNRVEPKIIARVEKICNELDGVINQEFVHCDQSMADFHKVLEEKKKDLVVGRMALKQLDELIDRLTKILDAMGELTTINKLIEQLVQIEKAELRASEQFKKKMDIIKDNLLNNALK